MGTVSTVTIGTDTFSVYALTTDPVGDANTFHKFQLGANANAWNAASTADKKRALAMGADWLDRAVGPVLSGTKTVLSQPREWPRDGATCYSEPVPNGTTPDDFATANFWLGGAILADNSIAVGEGTGSNIKNVKAGSASVSFFTPTLGSATDTRLPVVAQDYVKCYFGLSASLLGFASGVNEESAFCEDDYTRDQGYP